MKSAFRTNLDLKTQECFPVIDNWVPRIGEYVCSGYVHPNGTILRLEVYNVTYRHNYAEVELHLPKAGFLGRSISEFQKIYENMGKSILDY